MIKRPTSKVLLLLFSEILLIATSAFWDGLEQGTQWPIVIYSVFFCAGGYVLVDDRRWLITYIVLTAVAILSAFLSAHHLIFGALNLCCLLGTNILLFQAVVRHSVLNRDIAQSDRILAGVAGYVLLGIFWAGQFGWLNLFDGNALAHQATETPATASERLYFSFISLTTLGYGDIVPVTPFARVLIMFTTLSGVLYLAVFISALVGGLKRE